MPTIEELALAFSKRKAPIKAVLLDQSKPVAGIGNWMVDEILYQSRIHPAHTACLLSLDQSTAIHTQIVNVVTTACGVNADSKKFPNDWLFNARWVIPPFDNSNDAAHCDIFLRRWSKGKKDIKDFVLVR